MDTVREGEVGPHGDSSTEIHTSPRVKSLEGSCCGTEGAQPGLCDDSERWDDGREAQGGRIPVYI